MNQKPDFWQRVGLSSLFLKKEQHQPAPGERQTVVANLTPDEVYRYLLEKFYDSIKQLSFGNRIVFYHEYIICLGPHDYQQFMDNRKGLFGVIVQEAVAHFHQTLQNYRQQGKTVEPGSDKWVFRFVENPDYGAGDKSFIGKLLPGRQPRQNENLRVTFIPRQTGIAETYDVNADFLSKFNTYTDGYYEVPFDPAITAAPGAASHQTATARSQLLARLETIVPEREYAGKKIEYLMHAGEIVVTGKDDPQNDAAIFKIPSEWVDTPHLRIRYHEPAGKFYLASFGEKTILNEHEVTRSTEEKPHWVELPVNSRIVLNGIVGVNIFKS